MVAPMEPRAGLAARWHERAHTNFAEQVEIVESTRCTAVLYLANTPPPSFHKRWARCGQGWSRQSTRLVGRRARRVQNGRAGGAKARPPEAGPAARGREEAHTNSAEQLEMFESTRCTVVLSLAYTPPPSWYKRGA
eukprot:scaffold127732_cov46-Tisochrysis_lutea.AAC.1